MDRRIWPQLQEQNDMAREVMEGHYSQKKINAVPMQEFNSPVVYLDVLYKNLIKENLKNKKIKRINLATM